MIASALLIMAVSISAAQAPSDPVYAVDVNISAAEESLSAGEQQTAESRYRSALMAGWMLIGALRIADNRLADARDAFTRASTSVVDANAALQALAVVQLQMGDAPSAVAILTRLAAANPADVASHRLLAQALVASGQPEQAVQELEETVNANPNDPEITFTLASGYLRLKKLDAAQRLFDEVVKARPLPETHVLIGRTYRDAGQYDRAARALGTALKMNPRVRRAHYYLGTIAVMADGVTRLDEAIAEFQQELKLAPNDAATNLRLGMALVEARRETSALPALEAAVRAGAATANAFYYLGRCQLALDRASAAITSLRRALDLTAAAPADGGHLRSIHYQLALALQKAGSPDEASAHFAEAQRFSAQQLATERERLGRYLADAADANEIVPVAPALDLSSFSGLTAERRADIERRTTTALARAYVNLGVMQAQKRRFARAAEFFEQAVGLDASFPQAQYSLGVSYFNAQQYEKAVAPLARAIDADPGSAITRRMLAIAYLNTDAYAQAAELLARDSDRSADPSLQYAYGLALVRSNRAVDAEAIFSRMLTDHAETAELSVVLGHAYAEQGNYDAAIDALQRALKLKPAVADANSALGRIYLKRGELPEAAAALRAEVQAHADDMKARHTLATVLDLDGRQDEALVEVRTVLRSKPDFADARYLVGKILLARGAPGEVVEAAAHLEVAARLAPEDANVRYQLARAYEKLGRADRSEEEFAKYRELKEKQRGRP